MTLLGSPIFDSENKRVYPPGHFLMQTSSFVHWNDLLPELRDKEIAAQLNPATRQALSWTCKAHHAQWHDPELTWVKRELPTPQQKEHVHGFALEQLTAWVYGMPDRRTLSMYIVDIIWERDVRTVYDVVKPAEYILDRDAHDTTAYAYIKTNRLDDYVQLRGMYVSLEHDNFFVYAAQQGNVEFLVRFDKIRNKNITELFVQLAACQYTVDWGRLMQVSIWKHYLTEMPMRNMIYTMHRVQLEPMVHSQLPAIWPYLTAEQKRDADPNVNKETGVWMNLNDDDDDD